MFTNELDQLYQRLENYQLDDPNHEFGFTRHLIRNNGWTKRYADRAIAEYKKFVFLTVVAEHQIVPSDTVDQVWHAHLLLTKSYWEEFCPQILGKKLHHHPTKGGKEERAKFHDLYRHTIASYQKYFGKPPQDIWSPPEIRFGKEVKMQRISKVDNWIISKNLLPKNLAKLALVMGIIVFVLAISGLKPAFATSTSEFTNFDSWRDWYYFLIPAISGLIIRHEIRQPRTQKHKPVLNEYEIAYLADGKNRAVELAITKLVYQGYLRPNVRNRTFAIAKAIDPELANLEKQVMKQIRKNPQFKNLRITSNYDTDILRTRLEKDRLKLKQKICRAAIHPLEYFINFWFYYYFLPIGIAILLNQFENETFLAFFSSNKPLQIGIVIFYLCIKILAGRTYWGDRVLKDIRKQDTGFDPIQRFALYGESSLSGGVLDDLKQIYKAQKQEDDAAGCGC